VTFLVTFGEICAARDDALARWSTWCAIQLVLAGTALPHIRLWPCGFLPGMGQVHDALLGEVSHFGRLEIAEIRRRQGWT
jgi:hypothetical protein